MRDAYRWRGLESWDRGESATLAERAEEARLKRWKRDQRRGGRTITPSAPPASSAPRLVKSKQTAR
jgi:hypothetical protein